MQTDKASQLFTKVKINDENWLDQHDIEDIESLNIFDCFAEQLKELLNTVLQSHTEHLETMFNYSDSRSLYKIFSLY